MSKYRFDMGDKNRVDFPDCMYSRSLSKNVQGADANGAVSSGFIYSGRCNLQYLRVHSLTNVTGWLHLYDISADDVQTVSGKLPDYPPVELVNSKTDIIIQPQPDIFLNDERLLAGMGLPWDRGIYLVISSNEGTTTPAENSKVIFYARLFTGGGGTGQIPSCK